MVNPKIHSLLSLAQRLDGGYNIAPGYGREFYIGPDAFRYLRFYLPQLRRDFFGTKVYPAPPPNFPDSWFQS